MNMLISASQNRQAQKTLLSSLDELVEGLGYETVAERIDTSVEELIERLDGECDVTLTELRLIAIAAGVTITYSVAAVADKPVVVTDFDDVLGEVRLDAAA